MEYMENWLKELKEIEPIGTGEQPVIGKLEDVKAIIFDIYGTLLVSASGDINQAEILGSNLKKALKEAHYQFKGKDLEDNDKIIADLLARFVKLIHTHHDRQRESGIRFPEVDIRKVWEDLVEYGISENILKKSKDSDPVKLTFVFELLSNQVWPMPHMEEVLEYLKGKGFPMGIVSNAQFYTPVMMNYFLTQKIIHGNDIKYFDPELTVFSFNLLKAKPDKTIFEPVINTLEKKYGIAAGESVFIGNDMYKDIYPANATGMKTVFFAGDKRSLRLRKDMTEVKGLRPDAVITDLEQLKQIF